MSDQELEDEDEEVKSYHQLYYEKNKGELRKKNREYLKNYYIRNKDKFKQFYQDNREEKLAYQTKYNEESKENIKNYQAEYFQRRKRKKYRDKVDEFQPQDKSIIKVEKKQIIINWD